MHRAGNWSPPIDEGRSFAWWGCRPVLLDQSDPFNPVNRRISIIVMNQQAEESVTRDNSALPRANEDPAQNKAEQLHPPQG